MRSCAIIINLFFAGFVLNAQEKNEQVIDSLEQLLQQPLPRSERLKVLNRLTGYFIDVNTERFVALANEALSLVDSTTDKHQAGVAYMNSAMATEALGDYISSLAYNAKALQIFIELDDSVTMGYVFNNIGIAYNQMGDYGMAIYYLLKAAEINEIKNDFEGAGTAYINISEAYYNAKNYNRALELAHQAYHFLKNSEAEYIQGYAYEMLATAFIELNKFDSARYYIHLSRSLGMKYGNEYLINRNMGHMGRMYLKMKKYDSAQYYLTRTIQQSKGKHLSDVLLPATLALSQSLLAEGKINEALSQANWVHKSSKEIENNVLTIESCVLLSRIYENLGDKDEALNYLKQANALKAKIMEQSVQASLQAKEIDLTLEREKRAKLAALASLEKSDKILVRQRYIIISAIVVLLSLVTLLYLLFKINIARKRTNEKLAQNNEQLNRLNQEVNGLIHTIVHDLKSPLNSLQGILFVLEHQLKNNPQAMELIGQGHRVLAGGHEIIAELLELKELEEKPISLQLEIVSLKRVIDEIVAEYQPYTRQKDILLTANAPDVEVMMDRHIVKRLITNLVSNAIKFSPKGRPVHINASRSNGHVVFEVIDQGPGFSAADIEKMYAKFQRLSARPTGGENSNGLGLAIVDLLVKQLNASIDLKTELGKGSAFTVTVPV